MLTEQEKLNLWQNVDALKTGHFVFTSLKHGDKYLNKDSLYPHTQETSLLCADIAEKFAEQNIEAVIAPASGGIILSQWISWHLSQMTGRQVIALYADKKTAKPQTPYPQFVIKRGYDKLIKGKKVFVINLGNLERASLGETLAKLDAEILSECYLSKYDNWSIPDQLIKILKVFAQTRGKFNCDAVIGVANLGIIPCLWLSHELTLLSQRQVYAVYAEPVLPKTNQAKFYLPANYAELISKKRTLVVEDILTTGGSAAKVVQLAKDYQAEVIGLAALCNRNSQVVNKEFLQVPELYSQIKIDLAAWKEEEIPDWLSQIPINTEYGKGKEYLAAKALL